MASWLGRAMRIDLRISDLASARRQTAKELAEDDA